MHKLPNDIAKLSLLDMYSNFIFEYKHTKKNNNNNNYQEEGKSLFFTNNDFLQNLTGSEYSISSPLPTPATA
jgi:hypothetical protein